MAVGINWQWLSQAGDGLVKIHCSAAQQCGRPHEASRHTSMMDNATFYTLDALSCIVHPQYGGSS